MTINVINRNHGLTYTLIPAYGKPGHLEVVPF